MDVVGLLGAIQKRARENGKTAMVERCMVELAMKVGMDERDIHAVEDYAHEVGSGAVVYYP